MLKVTTYLIAIVHALLFVLCLGLAIASKKENEALNYYLKSILEIPILIWLYYIMQNLGYL